MNALRTLLSNIGIDPTILDTSEGQMYLQIAVLVIALGVGLTTYFGKHSVVFETGLSSLCLLASISCSFDFEREVARSGRCLANFHRFPPSQAHAEGSTLA